ncbi:MAG TPA: hypothetical protein VGC09_18900 [Rhodopila sp.]
MRHADDEKLMDPLHDKIAGTGIRNVGIHKIAGPAFATRVLMRGLFTSAVAAKVPRLRPYTDVGDIGRAANDRPQRTFQIHDLMYRWVGGDPADGMAEVN